MAFDWHHHLAAFAVSLALAWTLTPLMLRLAVRTGVVDAPDLERKTQKCAVPYLGGLAIVVAFSVAVLAAASWAGAGSGVRELAVLLGLGLLLALTGLLDDLRGLGPGVRLVVEVGAGVAVWANGSGMAFGPAPVALVITVLWVVGITNALNLLDNMDGLSAGVAVIASVGFFAVAALNGQHLVAALAAALAGCSAGFLRHNFHPARIYMGDAGALFLGFLLAVLGLRLRLEDTPQVVALFVPVLILGVALFDTTLVTVNRLRHGRSPMVGGRDHVSHRLVWVGMTVPGAVALVYAVAVSLAWLAAVLARMDAVTGVMLVAFVLVMGTSGFVLLSAVPVYETSRRRAAMLQVVRTHEAYPVDPQPGPALTAPAARLPQG